MKRGTKNSVPGQCSVVVGLCRIIVINLLFALIAAECVITRKKVFVKTVMKEFNGILLITQFATLTTFSDNYSFNRKNLLIASLSCNFRSSWNGIINKRSI